MKKWKIVKKNEEVYMYYMIFDSSQRNFWERRENWIRIHLEIMHKQHDEKNKREEWRIMIKLSSIDRKIKMKKRKKKNEARVVILI